MALIQISDFKGEVAITKTSYNSDDVQTYIDNTSKEVLRKLMGDKLYSEYLADLDGNGDPQTQKFIDLVDGKTYENSCGRTVIYEGLKKFLLYFIWHDYQLGIIYKNAGAGTHRQDNENSNKPSWYQLSSEAKRVHDKGVPYFKSAWRFIYEFRSTYFPDDEADWTYKPIYKKSKLITKTIQ